MNFDPLTGKPPVLHERSFDHVLIRARALLQSRTSDEIGEIYESLQLMYMDNGPYALEMKESKEKPEDLSEFPDVYKNNLTHISPTYDVLKLVMNEFDLSDGYWVDGEWYEYFAALAIGKVAEAVEDEKHITEEGLDINDTSNKRVVRSQEIITLTLGEAMEAITLAEYMRDNANETKKSRKQRAKKAANARHRKGRETIDELVRFYHDGKYKTYAAATTEFLKIVEDHKVRHIMEHNRHKNLSEALSKAIRQQNNSED